MVAQRECCLSLKSGPHQPHCPELLRGVGKKIDTGKAPVMRGLFAYFPKALLAVSQVSAYGAKKYNLDYSDKNWARVPGGLGRYSDADARHLISEAFESHDPESNYLHAAHHAWNALARLELILGENTLEETLQPVMVENRKTQRRVPREDWRGYEGPARRFHVERRK